MYLKFDTYGQLYEKRDDFNLAIINFPHLYGFSSTGVTIYCYFGLKFNDNTCCEVICKRRYNDNDLITTNNVCNTLIGEPDVKPSHYYYNNK
jgi:hypothetical protein